MTATSPVSQNRRRTLYRNLMFVLIAMVASVAVTSRLFDMHLHALSSLLLLATLAVSVMQFQSLDEVAKQAHYVAWYWGSMAVIAAIGVGLVVLYALPEGTTLPVEPLLVAVFGDADPDTAFVAGFLATLLPMVIGFFAWWAVYWLRRR